jgi:hypothetical protein
MHLGPALQPDMGQSRPLSGRMHISMPIILDEQKLAKFAGNPEQKVS